MMIVVSTLYIDTFILPAIILNIFSFHILSLKAEWANWAANGQPKQLWGTKHGGRQFSKLLREASIYIYNYGRFLHGFLHCKVQIAMSSIFWIVFWSERSFSIFSAFIFVARRSYIIFCLPKTSNSFEIYSKVQFEDDDDDESEKSLWKQINLSKGWTTTDDFLWVFTKLGFILAYFYVCDRTNFLMKENKWVKKEIHCSNLISIFFYSKLLNDFFFLQVFYPFEFLDPSILCGNIGNIFPWRNWTRWSNESWSNWRMERLDAIINSYLSYDWRKKFTTDNYVDPSCAIWLFISEWILSSYGILDLWSLNYYLQPR